MTYPFDLFGAQTKTAAAATTVAAAAVDEPAGFWPGLLAVIAVAYTILTLLGMWWDWLRRVRYQRQQETMSAQMREHYERVYADPPPAPPEPDVPLLSVIDAKEQARQVRERDARAAWQRRLMQADLDGNPAPKMTAAEARACGIETYLWWLGDQKRVKTLAEAVKQERADNFLRNMTGQNDEPQGRPRALASTFSGCGARATSAERCDYCHTPRNC